MTKIKDFHEKDRLTQNLLIKSAVKGVTTKGAPYLKMTLQDDTDEIVANLWDADNAQMELAVAGHVAEFKFDVIDYNHVLQLRILQIRAVNQADVDMSEFVMSSAKNTQVLMEQVEGLVRSISNPNYRTLVQGILDKVGRKFYEYPAASRIHHAYMGGLADHTLSMAELAEHICAQYPLLDRNLLISAVLVHDAGKTAELGGLIASEYTEEGKLTGHISICHGWLMEVADANGIGESEEALLLRHMVLAHHGKQEFGSPILPAVPEAEALSLIDNLDARMNTLSHVLAGVKPGQWSQRVFALENRQFYNRRKGN